MVKAVQAGRKIQTRRMMYPQPARVEGGRFFRPDGREIICPFGLPGDRLWVRERFAGSEDGKIVYAADPVKGRSRLQWRTSREMQRSDSRLTLLVVSTRPQQLQEISEADARAEGYDPEKESLDPIAWFTRLWDRLTPIEAMRWAANPWLWVVDFKVMQAERESIAPIAERPESPEKIKRTPRTATVEERHQLAQRLRDWKF